MRLTTGPLHENIVVVLRKNSLQISIKPIGHTGSKTNGVKANLILVAYSIQFILYSPISQICLKEFYNLYTYDIPVPGPHIGSGKTPNK